MSSDLVEILPPVPVQADRPHVPGDSAAAESTQRSVDPVTDIADQLIRLVRTYGYLKARLVASVDPEMGAMFLVGRLVKEGPTRAKDLAEATCADQSTVSRQVAALVKAGLVERQADPDDGRASILMPTQLGVAKFEQHFVNRGRALEPVLTDWPASDREQFLRLLTRFNTGLDSRREDMAKVMAEHHLAAQGGAHLSQEPPAVHLHGAARHPGMQQHRPDLHSAGHSTPASTTPQPHASTERSN